MCYFLYLIKHDEVGNKYGNMDLHAITQTKLSYRTFIFFFIPADLYIFYTYVHISTKGKL